MIKMFKNDFLFKKIDGRGLAIFRILIATVLFCELFTLSDFSEIIYSKVPFVQTGEFNAGIVYQLWMLVVVMIALGFFTMPMAIVNYVFSAVIFGSAEDFEYHMFYGYILLSVLLIFMPLSRHYSIDSLIRRVKYSNENNLYEPGQKVLALNYLFPVFALIGLFYFDSVLFKLDSRMWLNGLGMWKPANIPMVTWSDTSWLMNNEGLVIFLGYTVIVFEVLFVFTFWLKKFRLPMMLIGIGFHLGILLEFPIPWFALAFCVVYLLMMPVSFWLFLSRKLKVKKAKGEIYFDIDNTLSVKAVAFLKGIDLFGRLKIIQTKDSGIFTYKSLKNDMFESGTKAFEKALFQTLFGFLLGIVLRVPLIARRLSSNVIKVNITGLNLGRPLKDNEASVFKGWSRDKKSVSFWIFSFIIIMIFQGIISYGAPVPKRIVEKLGVDYSKTDLTLRSLRKTVRSFSKKYLGVANHGVFIDNHFKGFNHIIKVSFHDLDKSFHVPILDDRGLIDDLVRGSIWRNVAFNVLTPKFTDERLERELKKYLVYYLSKREYSKDAYFSIAYKRIDIPMNWEKDFLRKQIAIPWKEGGIYFTESTKFSWSEGIQEVFKNEKKDRYQQEI